MCPVLTRQKITDFWAPLIPPKRVERWRAVPVLRDPGGLTALYLDGGSLRTHRRKFSIDKNKHSLTCCLEKQAQNTRKKHLI